MPTCCAVYCTNNNLSFRLFQLPSRKRNSQKRKIWIHRIAKKDRKLTSNDRLCDSALSFHKSKIYDDTKYFLSKVISVFQMKNWLKRSMKASSNWGLFNYYAYFRHSKFLFKFI